MYMIDQILWIKAFKWKNKINIDIQIEIWEGRSTSYSSILMKKEKY
jgi:hypothetical protein